MLKKLHIQNFQSHKSTTIDFTNGLNVIIGQSDGGKSSIIRAISAVCYNTWDSDSMRVGETCCKITLETDKGIVTLTKDTKNKINAYNGVRFQDNEQFLFQSVGVSVPQIVNEITGMSPLKIADTAVDIPNIMYQLDKHYMLAQVSGKSCTSNLIARIFDKVIGLGGMEQLISQISSSMINDKKQITKKMAEADQLKNDLVDQYELIQKQLNIKTAKKLKKEISQSQFNVEKIQTLIDNYNNLQIKLNSIDSTYVDLDVDSVKALLNNLTNSIKKLQLIENIESKSNQLNDNLNTCQSIINSYSDLDRNKIEQIKQICNKLYVADKTVNKYNSLVLSLNQANQILEKYADLDNAEGLLQNVKQICNKLYVADKTNSKFSQKSCQLNDIEEQIVLYENQYKQFYEKLETIKRENKVCPLCGNSFQNCKGK